MDALDDGGMGSSIERSGKEDKAVIVFFLRKDRGRRHDCLPDVIVLFHAPQHGKGVTTDRDLHRMNRFHGLRKARSKCAVTTLHRKVNINHADDILSLE